MDVLLRAINSEQTDAYLGLSFTFLFFFIFCKTACVCIRSYYFDKMKCLHRCLVCVHISNGVSSAIGALAERKLMDGCRQVYTVYCIGLINSHFFFSFSFYCFARLRRLCARIIETRTAVASCVAFVCTHDATMRCDRMSTSVAIRSTVHTHPQYRPRQFAAAQIQACETAARRLRWAFVCTTSVLADCSYVQRTAVCGAVPLHLVSLVPPLLCYGIFAWCSACTSLCYFSLVLLILVVVAALGSAVARYGSDTHTDTHARRATAVFVFVDLLTRREKHKHRVSVTIER